jgi:hypothetical protein
VSSDEMSKALPVVIVFFIIIGIPIFIYMMFGFETKTEGNTVTFRKKMWAVWAGMAAYFCLSLWIFYFTFFLLFIAKTDAEFPSWLRYTLSVGGIIAGVTFCYRAIQVYRNRFDKITVFEDRIEIVNNGHVPVHTTIFFRDIKEMNVTDNTNGRDDDDSSYLKINDYVLDLRDVNLRSKCDEIGQILKTNLNAFRAKNSQLEESSNQ